MFGNEKSRIEKNPVTFSIQEKEVRNAMRILKIVKPADLGTQMLKYGYGLLI